MSTTNLPPTLFSLPSPLRGAPDAPAVSPVLERVQRSLLQILPHQQDLGQSRPARLSDHCWQEICQTGLHSWVSGLPGPLWPSQEPLGKTTGVCCLQLVSGSGHGSSFFTQHKLSLKLSGWDGGETTQQWEQRACWENHLYSRQVCATPCIGALDLVKQLI